jgi:hypothetical protein
MFFKLWWYRLWLLYVWLLPFWLFISKYLEIQRERIVRRATPPATLPVFDETVGRRLDDPVFWATVVSAVAGLLVIRGGQLLGDPTPWLQPRKKQYLYTWLAVFVPLLLIYLGITFFRGNGEALFFCLGEGDVHDDTVICTLQFIGGVFDVLLIAVMSQFFALAMMAIGEVVTRAKAAPTPTLKVAASYIASSGLVPIVPFFVAPLLYAGITSLYGITPLWTYPWPIWPGMIAILPLAIPFAIVLFTSLVRFKTVFRRRAFSLFTALQFVVWCGLVATGLSGIVPPQWLVAYDRIVGIILALISLFVIPATLGLVLAGWVTYR